MLIRKINIDYLRITACLMVIFLHLSAQYWHTTNVMTFEWSIYNFYDCLVRSAVPLFFMISGTLFLNKNSMPSLNVLFKKNILKMFIVYIFWSFLYALDSAGIKGGIDLDKIIYFMVNAKYHLWYLPVLIGMYFILPLFWIIAKFENGKYLKYICTMFFLFAIIKPTLGQITFLDYPVNEFLDNFNFALVGYTGYYLYGYVLERYKNHFNKIHTWSLVVLFAFIVFVAAEFNLFYARFIRETTSLFYNNSIFVFLEALILFMIYLRLPHISVLEKHSAFILKISKNTLFVYLLHVFVMEKLNMYFGINVLIGSPIISIPLLSLLIFIICQIIAEILNKIPFVNKWLM